MRIASWPRVRRLYLPEFIAPLPLLAVAVLALNDAVLKARFHNALTGKLSDLAGCFFLPLYVSALLSLVSRWSLATRVSVGAGVTTALFTATSVSRFAADGLCAALSPFARLLGVMHLRIAADPTDLIALPMVALAVKFALSRIQRGRTAHDCTQKCRDVGGVGGDAVVARGDEQSA